MYTMNITADAQLQLNDEFAATVYALLATKSQGTPQSRTADAADVIDTWFGLTEARPANDLLERLADYILFAEPDILTETQLHRRFIREPSTAELSD